MNLRFWFLIGYSLVFFLGGYWVFQLTSLSQFALVLLGYVGLACGCLGWWTAHAYDASLGRANYRTRRNANRTEEVLSQFKPHSTTVPHLTGPTGR